MCNILSGHDQVAAAHHTAHWGFHESNLLKNRRFWGDLTPLDSRIRFLATYTEADHFRLVDGDRNALEEELEVAATRGTIDFYDAFFHTMDRFARTRGKKFWLTKLDPLFFVYPKELALFLDRLAARYRSRGWIGIERGAGEVARSYINMEGRATQRRTSLFRTPFFILFETARHVVHYRRIAQMAKTLSFPVISYRELRDNPTATIDRVCDHLGLERRVGLESSRYLANSSIVYRGRYRDLGPATRWIIDRIVRPMLLVIWPMTVALVASRERVRSRTAPVYFKLQKLMRYPTRYREELFENDESALAQVLFDETSSPDRRSGREESNA